MKTNSHSHTIGMFLSYVLRHKPESIGLKLDDYGWANVEELITASALSDQGFTKEELDAAVADDSKGRYAFNEDRTRIRANQGHSIPIILDLEPAVPPNVLLHGTARRFWESISRNGLIKKERHHVHLTQDKDAALEVGKRYGPPMLLVIDAEAMHNQGHKFWLTANNVWLTDAVPTQFITMIPQ